MKRDCPSVRSLVLFCCDRMAFSTIPLLFLIVLTLCTSAIGISLVRPSDIALQQPSPPEWAAQYEVSWELAVPYVSKLQSTPLKNTYQAWQDTEHGRQKFTRDGVETTVEKLGKNGEPSLQYQIYPRIDKLDCRTDDIGGGAGPTAQRRLLWSAESSYGPANAAKLGLILPDLTEDRWQYNGSATLDSGRHHGQQAHAWVWRVTNDEGYGAYHNTYTLYADDKGAPLRMIMWGVNLYTGGHFDLYIVDYYGYKEGPIDEDEFRVPDFCPEKPDTNLAARLRAKRMGGLARMRALLPNAHYGDEEYDGFVLRHGRRHRSPEEYQGRRQVYYENKGRVEAWNAAGDTSHELGVNHFADWTQEEFEAVMLPNKDSGRERPSLADAAAAGQLVRRHRPRVPAHLLPSAVDWRGTPADSPVKDQAACGSCWAFGSVASIEAAYFATTGKQLLLSEQNLIDCAWDYGNTGCLGGFQELAYDYMADVLQIATEEAYPYEGVTNFCRKKNESDIVRFKSFGSVWVNATDEFTQEQAVMEAIYTRGPMTVSVNAEGEDWRFYKSGVYNNTACSPKLKRLDHAVIVSGYGETPQGEKYWIVKNTWSANWGEEGYIRISRDPAYDCGIATQAIYTEIELAE